MFLHICSKEVAPKKLDRFTWENEDVNIKSYLGGKTCVTTRGISQTLLLCRKFMGLKTVSFLFNLGNDIYSKIKTCKFIMIKICTINL